MVSSDISNKAQIESSMRVAHERARLLLDATPLACRLMKKLGEGKYEVFECNEESVRLFNFSDKQKFKEQYFKIYPEYQPNGKKSVDEGQRVFEEAYTNGKCVTGFVFQTKDGEPVPAEVTLVRVKYGDEYVVAGYTRDMREHNRMMEEINIRNKLLNMGNSAVQTLLSMDDDTDIEKALLQSLEIVGNAVRGDRVQIWRNEMIDGALHFVYSYEWLSDVGKQTVPVPIGLHFPYSVMPEWKEFFSRDQCLNAPISALTEKEFNFLKVFDIKSIVIIPLFIKGKYWGFFCIVDCLHERVFTEDEITILRSVSHMLVSALKRNAQAIAIREAHDRVRVLLDRMPLACHLWSSNYEMIDCNEENSRLFEVTEKNEIMNRWSDFIPEYQPDGQCSGELAHILIKTAFEENKVISCEFMHLTSKGALLPTEATLVRIPYEEDFAVAVYLRDLRDQKKMIKELEQKSNLLDKMNKAANILLQSELDEFEKNLHLCMGMIGEAVNADRMCIWKNNIKEGKLYCSLVYEWVADVRMRTVDDISTDVLYEENIPTWELILSKGECINAVTRDLPPIEQSRLAMHGIKSIFVAPVFVKGNFWGFVGCDNCSDERSFCDDVATALRSGSVLIAHALLRNEMTVNLKAVACELETALKETQKANSAKSYFLANMSHEMRTPLHAIIGLSCLSLENNALEEDIRLNLEQVYKSGDMLLSIVNDILDISKIEAGKMELVELDYDVPSLINDTVAQNFLRIGEKPIQFKLDICDGLFARLYGDELRFKQIMNNLLSNAIKYTDDGIVELSVHCEQDGDTIWVIIKVSDTGKGIRSEDLDKLFNEYSQLDMESNRKTEGTGLGLQIAKRLTEMMKGSISVESEYGKGSTFTVRIAQKFIADVHIGQEVVDSLKNFSYSDKKRGLYAQFKRISLPYARVLVVDDVVTNLEVARGFLKPYGMQVDCVSSGIQAIAAIRDASIRYNAVFMDHMMPEMNGIEATRIIREEIGTEYAKSIPIIALTANAIAGNEEMFLNKGFQAFLPKPIEIPRLDAVIRRWVRDTEQEKLFREMANGPNEIGRRTAAERKSVVDWQALSTGVSGLNMDKGIQYFGGDEGSYFTVLRTFAANTPLLLEKIATVTPDTMADYSIAVHGLRGSSRSICADDIANIAEALEHATKTDDYDFITAHNASLLEAAWKLISEIDAMLLQIHVDTPKPCKDAPDKEVLSRIVEACKRYDMDTVDAAIKELESYEYKSGGELVPWLWKNAQLFNLEQIIEKLSE